MSQTVTSNANVTGKGHSTQNSGVTGRFLLHMLLQTKSKPTWCNLYAIPKSQCCHTWSKFVISNLKAYLTQNLVWHMVWIPYKYENVAFSKVSGNTSKPFQTHDFNNWPTYVATKWVYGMALCLSVRLRSLISAIAILCSLAKLDQPTKLAGSLWLIITRKSITYSYKVGYCSVIVVSHSSSIHLSILPDFLLPQ